MKMTRRMRVTAIAAALQNIATSIVASVSDLDVLRTLLPQRDPGYRRPHRRMSGRLTVANGLALS